MKMWLKRVWNWLTGNNTLEFDNFKRQDKEEALMKQWEKFFVELNRDWVSFFNEEGPFNVDMETLDFYAKYKVLVEHKLNEHKTVKTPEVVAAKEAEVVTPKRVRKSRAKVKVKTEE